MITTRGIVVVPDLPTDRLVHPARSVEVELRLPGRFNLDAALRGALKTAPGVMYLEDV